MNDSREVTPHCIGIILDGNRRWARERGLPTLDGHRKGFENLIDATRWVRDRGISHLAVYAFSTENWNRSPEEVSYLMDLFKTMAGAQLADLAAEGIRTRFIGQRERFSSEMQALMQETEAKGASDARLTLWTCLSYGGRAEIVEAAAILARRGETITEKTLRAAMWTADMPDPDLIIRTGGEKRLSGFLTWGSVYSELFFVKKYWPDFNENDLGAVLGEYAQRERRMGK